MSMNQANHDIHCGVDSCKFHCDEQAYCSLRSIHVEPCMNCGSGKADDESMCASYKAK